VGDPHSEASCLLRLAETAVERRAFTEAATRFDEARLLFQQTRDRRGEANVLYGTGQIALQCGKYEEARARFGQAQAMYREIEERRGEALCQLSLGDVALGTGDGNSARTWYEQAMAGFRIVQDSPLVGESLLRLARLEGRPEKRSGLIGECVELYRATNRQDLIDDLAREFPEVRRTAR
jgi:tetratricopeptide (TPR) repeat protein